MAFPRDAVGVSVLGDKVYAVGGYDGQHYLKVSSRLGSHDGQYYIKVKFMPRGLRRSALSEG